MFLFSEPSICLAVAFPPLGFNAHVFVLVPSDFPSYSKRDALFHWTCFDYSHADWDDLCDRCPWEDVFNLGFSAAASTLYTRRYF